MGKVLKSVALGAALIGVSFLIPGAGIALLGTTITSGAVLMAGITSVLAGLATVALSPKIPQTQLSRLNVSLEPTTPRKSVFGTTAMNLDMRYHESSGSDQEYVDYIIAVAAHKVKSIDQIWFEEKLAWSLAGGVQATYSGYLTVDVRTEGTSGNYITINSGTKWGSSRRLTGCAYIHLRIKRTGATKKAESPLVNGLPSRITVIGEGAPLYDPRLDSTVPGGSGAHRADNQATWGSYTDADDCDNPALQLLWWLLGWKINDKLSVGCGVPPERIDLESFITAANICDESVSLSIGGTQKRYRTSGTASDSDSRMDIIGTLLSCMNGTLRDNNGKLTVTALKNDLADWVLDFSDDDILEEFKWDQTRGLNTTFNKVRGRYIDPSNNSLYQLVEYPEVGFASPDGIERVMTLDLPYVEDGRRAQRIAKQVLQRNQYRGMFSATFTAKALGCSVGDIVRLSFTPLGWSNKPFRVVSQQISFDGRVPLALVEENAAIYAWDNEDSAPVTPTAPTVYDPLNNPFILAITDAEAIADGKITSFYQTSAPTAEGVGDIWFDTDDGNKMYRWNGSSWVAAQDTAITQAINDAADAQATADGKITTFYQTSSPTAEGVGDLWVDTDDNNRLSRWNGSSWVNVRDGTIATAATTANWSGITDDNGNKPYDNADVTLDQAVVSKLDADTGNASNQFLSPDQFTYSQIAETGTARDGDNISFASTLPRVPKIIFLPGGEGVTAGDNIRIKAESLTTSGFTMIAKSQAVTAGSTITDASPSAGGSGNPDFVINRSNSGNPFDGVYTYRIFATIVVIDMFGTPDPLYVTYYAKKSSAWVEVASQVIAIPGGGSNYYNLEISPGTVDFGAGSEFGVSFYAPDGQSSGSFTNVKYTLGTVTETSLTPSGSSSIPWIGLLD